MYKRGMGSLSQDNNLTLISSKLPEAGVESINDILNN